ncbi:MAG TPA: aminotransferase class I/II-fold pyridoxal phosphate-dependent enzyme [Syntrophorhabdales bacterium]|nr:aminotransferase class I/II-fold pyridoxal phosphate-dependent enzyme [Syntrophorhabdales bacterium]
MIPYSRQLIEQDDIEAVTRVLRSDFLTQGPAVEAFESALTSYTGAHYAVLFASGTAALHAAHFAAGIGAGDEVLTSPITFAATSNAALYLGATPVFVDVEPDTGNMDVASLEQAITPRAKAIVPVHYAGHPVDLKAISLVAKEFGLIVIEDACHALGAEYRTIGAGGRGPVAREGPKDTILERLDPEPRTQDPKDGRSKIGSCTYSDMTVFSFHPVKQITTGEGGAVLTNRSDFYEKLRLFRTHGITKDPSKFALQDRRPQTGAGGADGDWYYEMQALGFNYRISDLHAALGISQLRKLDRFVSRRREIAERYRRAYADNPWFAIPPERSYAKSSYHLYPIRLTNGLREKRYRIFAGLKKAGVGVQVHYLPVYLHPYYQKMGYKEGLCPAAEDFYQREISIPLYPGMDDQTVDTVIKTLRRCFKKR